MLIHYIKTTFRNIRKYKTQTLTGIFGLAFAIACFVPALYWIRYENSYDSFYPGAKNIYRTYIVEKKSGIVNELTPSILVRKLTEQFPAVEAATSFIADINNCKTPDVPHISLRTLNTDSTFFMVFTPQFMSGDSHQPLLSELDIVITESVALALFGDVEKAIGQQLQSTLYFFHSPYTVKAVVKDPPPHTNLPFDALLNFDLIMEDETPEDLQWKQAFSQVYIKTNPHSNITNLAEELRDYTTRTGVNPDIETGIIPISDIRHNLNANVPFTLNFMRLFIAAGILLLFSAIFNFLNLHLDLFRQRIRELRQRTVHGATKKRLMEQMLFELSCSILLAFVLAYCFVILTRPAFTALLDINMETSQLIYLFLICGTGIMILMLLIGVITFRRLSHLAMRSLSKGKSSGQPVLRSMTVTLQLAVSVVFIVAALVVMRQIRFVDHKDPGFNRTAVIQLYGLPNFMQANIRTTLIHELEALPQITSIATGNFEPQHNAQGQEMVSYIDWPGKPAGESPSFNFILTDHRFAETLGINMIMGEWYKEGEENKFVLNEEAIRVMGISDPVGMTIRGATIDIEAAEKAGQNVEFQIVGVVSDFHTHSLRSPILPTIFLNSRSIAGGQVVMGNILYLHVVPGQEQEAIKRIKEILPGIDPSFADVRLRTLDDLYDSFNYSEQAGLKMFSILAIVCLFISLFGIYAVASASTQRRRKEIAIRKVVGAKVSDLVRIFFREYALQVIIAGAFALPVAYIAMSNWLQGYAYRTNIPWWLLAGVILGVVAVVLLTILGQVLKAANSNPANVIKTECPKLPS